MRRQGSEDGEGEVPRLYPALSNVCRVLDCYKWLGAKGLKEYDHTYTIKDYKPIFPAEASNFSNSLA